MKFLTKSIATFLAVTVMLSVLISCGTAEETVTDTTKKETETVETSTVETTAEDKKPMPPVERWKPEIVENGTAFYQDYFAEYHDGLSEKSVNVFIKRLNEIQKRYLEGKDLHIYNTVFPDKLYYMAELAGNPYPDYQNLMERLKKECDFHTIEIADTVFLDSYYRTDRHIRQEAMIPTANRILHEMGHNMFLRAEVTDSELPFYGCYYCAMEKGQTPDSLFILHSDKIDSASMRHIGMMSPDLTEGKIYDLETESGDLYDVFLGGASPLTVLENKEKTTGKTLYLFGDCYIRAMAPLFLHAYDKVVLYDIRYGNPSSLMEMEPIADGSDVLFAYSTLLVDVSSSLRVG